MIYLHSGWLNIQLLLCLQLTVPLSDFVLFCFVWATAGIRMEPKDFPPFYEFINPQVSLSFLHETEHEYLLKKKRKIIANVKNLITFIFFFHFFHPTLEFESKAERKGSYCPKCVPWNALCCREEGRVQDQVGHKFWEKHLFLQIGSLSILPPPKKKNLKK